MADGVVAEIRAVPSPPSIGLAAERWPEISDLTDVSIAKL
jgi:hypothetical protein